MYYLKCNYIKERGLEVPWPLTLKLASVFTSMWGIKLFRSSYIYICILIVTVAAYEFGPHCFPMRSTTFLSMFIYTYLLAPWNYEEYILQNVYWLFINDLQKTYQLYYYGFPGLSKWVQQSNDLPLTPALLHQ